MDEVNFKVNGESYSLKGSQVSSDTTLNDFLRYYLNLHGTKAMCHQGGCGACIVSVSYVHPDTKVKKVFSVNSCLVHILSCHQWDITTIEGLGNRTDGYHALQTRLAAFNGTQCGYCTPAWIMSMHSLQESSDGSIKAEQIENSFGGNICRCTGYRPILDAFKSFASDCDPALKDRVRDLEDIDKCVKQCKSKKYSISDDWCFLDDIRELTLKEGRWYKVYTVDDVFKIIKSERNNECRLVAGNTGRGVYPLKEVPQVQIDISSIESLKVSCCDVNLELGAGMTIADVMEIFEMKSNEEIEFQYLQTFYNHLDLVAHVAVRNIATIGGNLAMKNKYKGFPSDIFVLLATVRATVTVIDYQMGKTEYNMEEFLEVDLKNKLICNVKLPPLSSYCKVNTYKIMPRAQNALALVNAGIMFKLNINNVVQEATIVFGTISPSFIRAKETEKALQGLDLFKDDTLQKALNVLKEELKPVNDPPGPSPDCKKRIALGLLYKAILSLYPEANLRYKSGGNNIKRPISHGTQSFDTDKNLWPLNKPIPKLEALTQCSGEVKYSCDTNTAPREVHVAFVLSKVCVAELDGFDASEALSLPGVIKFFQAKDIPGKNSFTPKDVPWQKLDEEILASKTVSYYGQPVGLIVANTHKLAVRAADLVKVCYKNVRDKPVLTAREALAAPDRDRRVRLDAEVKPTNKGDDTKHVIKGSYRTGSQYHYTMETQRCKTFITEFGLSVHSSTQWMDLVNVAIAQMLAIDVNKVKVSVGHVGGAYGGKASRSALVACACALVAQRLGRTASLVLPLQHNMLAIGKRMPCDVDYEIGVNDVGVIQYLDMSYYSDCGFNYSDNCTPAIAHIASELYDSSCWTVKGYSVLTDTASNTWCRAPGTTEGAAIAEHIMERIAFETKQDPIAVRILNLSPKNDKMKDMINSFKSDISFDERREEIMKFNSRNAWKKQGLKLSLMAYPIDYSWNFPVTISVYHADGTVAISHGGIEMGQGINTKVAQVCAYTLKVPLEKIIVRGSNSFVSPNSMGSNGSITSDMVAYATVKACNLLLDRLKTVSSDAQTWEQTVKKAYDKGLNLQTTYMASTLDPLVGYTVGGLCAVHVELDILTGAHEVVRVDILEDTGISMSPDIDIGQIEGAFIMGLGMWTSEHLVYDRDGKLLTIDTWTYDTPGVKDIPVDFRISFKRNSVNPTGVLRSKATGEPAIVLAVAVTHALHEAIQEGRTEFCYDNTIWFSVDSPYNVENMVKAISCNTSCFKLK